MSFALPYTDAHHAFRETVGRFVEREVAPHHREWEDQAQVPRELWRKAGEAGFLCPAVPEEYGRGA